MRKLDLGKGPVVIPASTMSVPERELDADRARAFVVYPDNATGAEVAEIMRATADLVRASMGLEQVKEGGATG